MMVITEIDLPTKAGELAAVIRSAFQTVAEEFNITPQNAPTNPAFIKKEDLIKGAEAKSIKYYGCYERGKLLGCYALEKAGDGLYYLERVAVVPEARHRGMGKQLVRDAFKRVKECGGLKVSVAIIDEHRILKNWYKELGFKETGRKTFPHLPFNVCFLEYRL